MTSDVEQRLKAVGVVVPEAARPVANYVPYVVVDRMIFVSGQLPKGGSGLMSGKVGRDMEVEQARVAARLCAVNLLAQAREAAGGLDSIRRVVRIGGFVNCTDDFQEQPKVIDAVSDLMVEAFGDAGLHSRAAVGVNALPLGAAVEVEATFELR